MVKRKQSQPIRIAAIAVVVAGLLIVFGGFLSLRGDKPAKDADPSVNTVFNAQTTTLENGLQVVVVENNRAPVVTHMVWYKAGAADEAWGQSGIAHFLEHLMFKGSTGLEAGEFSRTVRALGGRDNAFTSQDYTAYFQSIAAEHLETVMRMEAGRMRGLTFSDTDFESERSVVIEERKQRIGNNIQAQLYADMRRAAAANHPYARPVIGWAGEVERATTDTIMDFYNQWYAPNNAILIVSGGVQAQAVFDMARAVYGGIPMTDNLPAPQRQAEILSVPARHTAAPVINHTHPNARQLEAHELYHVPSYNADPQGALALAVLANILDGASGRLYQDIVVEQKLADNVSVSYSGQALGMAEFWVSAYPAQGVEAQDVFAAIDAQLEDIRVNGLPDKELTRAITRMQGEAIYARDSLTGPAMIIGRGLTTGQSLEAIESWPTQLEALDAQDIQEAAHHIISPAVTGIITPPMLEEGAP